MNESHSRLPRLLSERLAWALRRFPVVILSGARQTGKTTLATMKPAGKGRMFLSLDEADIRARAERDPDALFSGGARITIDEAQRAPDLLLAVKRDVDRERRPGRFLLTGSANLLLMQRVTESLAGRAMYLCLWPFTESEKRGKPIPGPWTDLLAANDAMSARERIGGGKPLGDWAERAMVGGYPRSVFARDAQERAAWFESYVQTYLERDLRDLSAISDLSDFQRVMRLAALRTGGVLNQTDLARDANLSQPTVHRWLNLLETSFQIVRLPPYAVSRTKRLVKSPKIYWTDPGLAAHLAGLKTAKALAAAPRSGVFLENLLLVSLLAWREASLAPRPEILHWRTQTGDEVDFVIESGDRVLPVEVRAGARVTPSDAKGLDTFLAEYPKAAPFGLLLHGGTESFLLTSRILAAPIRKVLDGD